VDRDVLDVGAAELVGTVHQFKMERWPHQIIKGMARSVCGLEKSPEQISALRRMGFNIVQGDAEEFDLGTSFDVVFAGELIEHLSNPGKFLRCVRKHLRPGGLLLITTPNRFSIKALWSILIRNEVERYCKPIDGHVAYYDIWSLKELLEREGFTVTELGYYMWVGRSPSRRTVQKGYSLLARLRCHLLPGMVAVAMAVSCAEQGESRCKRV